MIMIRGYHECIFLDQLETPKAAGIWALPAWDMAVSVKCVWVCQLQNLWIFRTEHRTYFVPTKQSMSSRPQGMIFA